MRIILLEGKNKIGKTPTLQMVYAVLKLLNAKVISGPKRIDKMDFEAVLSFQNKIVAIFTEGDDQTDCNNAIKKYARRKYARKKVDVLIMAHRSSCGTINTDQYETDIVKKTVKLNDFEEMSSNIGDCLNILIHI